MLRDIWLPGNALGKERGKQKTRTLVASKGHDMKVFMFSLVVSENVATDYKSSSLRKLDGEVPTYF